MRKKDREVKEKSQIIKILDTAKILHLGLFDGEFPYIVPLHYGYEFCDEKLIFYIHAAKEGHKLDLIRQNPNVCVELECDVEPISGGEIACKYGAAYSSIIAKGKAESIEATKEKIHALKLLMKNQVARDFEIDEKMANMVAIIKVDVQEYCAKARKNPMKDY